MLTGDTISCPVRRPAETSAAVLLRCGRRRVWRKGAQLASLARLDDVDRGCIGTDFTLLTEDAESVEHQAAARGLESVHPDLAVTGEKQNVLGIEHLRAGDRLIGYKSRFEANGTGGGLGADHLRSCGGCRKRCDDGDSSKGFH